MSIRDSEFPFLVTILFAVVGWSITHIVDRAIDAPLIMYEEQFRDAACPKVYSITVRNLSRDRNFAGLVITFIGASQKDRFENPMSVADFPAGDAIEVITSGGVSFTFPALQPGWRVELSAEYLGDGRPQFRVEESPSALELAEKGWRTWLVQNEITLLIAIAALATLVIVFWLALS